MYPSFLARKSQLGGMHGFEPSFMPGCAFDFQQSLADWQITKGRGATLADCGLGKTLVELIVAENWIRHTNRPSLIITPLAVGAQTVREGEKFGIECHQSRDGKFKQGARIIVTNYEQLHLFDTNDFAGVVLDEASILKSFDGARRQEITEFMRTRPYRMLATATAAPNDYIELGTCSEALGHLGHLDMLNRFFKNDQHTIKPMRDRTSFSPGGRNTEHTDKWRFKGHAEIPFWCFVCSWARAGRRPSDFGPFDDERFVLPKLIERQHLVMSRTLADGMLFSVPAVGLKEQREERRRTIRERCEMVAELTAHTGEAALVWCQLNDEGDLLERIVPDCVQVSGKDSDEEKEEKFLAFTSGQIRVLATKEKIGAWGMNWQHCHHVLSFPTHSFEGYYQGLRRCLRFGQTHDVIADTITTEGQQTVLENRQRKAAAADKMFSNLVAQMRNAETVERGITFTEEAQVPTWL
jgi:hypothetical protein